MKHLLIALLFAVAPLTAQETNPAQGIVFCTYNVRNYLTGEQPPASRTKPKPEKEIEALIQIIREINPDILGVCEMGSPKAFEDFKSRLEMAGLGYKDGEYVQADDPDRHLALVSRFPIIARNSQPAPRYILNGTEHLVKRGFLDVTIQVTPGYRLRCVGVHLKSKLASPDGEALIRRHEAFKLRGHLDGILKAEPGTNLLCYGDFNDARNSPMFSEVTGPRGAAGHMTDLAAHDSVGDRWTHHWPVADEYARIDYLFAARGLLPEITRDSATVFRSPSWETASDHRPVFVTLFPVEKAK